ncbi:hypothetical protein BDP27DRAFT_1417468 [Rhodocollybia butyracea]|uniref:Uncharacterized protein n=1 Tax=Rhodocollybia butyracea TaxID=206335 RepID=A0A9P5UAF4_9AGAR|nr:hypothetical protein BDP27DRAFT_1417468 [Rhodocollybia butyracea]
MTSTRVDTILHAVRADLVTPNSSTSGTYQSPAAHCNNATPTATAEGSSDSDTGAARLKRREVTIEEVDDEELEMEENELRKRNRECSSDEEEWDPCASEFSEPSEYLCTQCLLCFGGTSKDAVVNADACFMQKHSSKGGRDPLALTPTPFSYPKTRLMPGKDM